MRRLTTDTPNGNWEIMLNFVFGQDNWAHIRQDGENENIPLTQWAKAQCLRNGCGEFSAEVPKEIDEEICDCMMSFPDCPIALAYCFASQVCHLRSRLKLYEDILFDKTGKERLTLDDLRALAEPNDPLTLEELREMDWEPAWTEGDCETRLEKSGWAILWYSRVEKYLCVWWPCREYADIPALDSYGKTWLAYRRKPEECLLSSDEDSGPQKGNVPWQGWLRSRFERGEG